GLFSHMHALKGAPETVMDYGVHQFCGAHTIADARLGQEIGCVAHAFHAASDVEVTIASLDGLGGEHNSLEARATDLVDGDGRHIISNATVKGCLARRCLALACRHDIAHDDFIYTLAGGVGALDRFANGDRAKLRGGEWRERAQEASYGGAHGAQDHRVTISHPRLLCSQARGAPHRAPHSNSGPPCRRLKADS